MTNANELNDEGTAGARALFVLMLDGEGRIAGVSFPPGSPSLECGEGDGWVGRHIHEVFVPSSWHGSSAEPGQTSAIAGTYTAASVMNAGLTAFSVNVVALPERAVSTMAYAAYARPLLAGKGPVPRDPGPPPPAQDRSHALQRVVGGLAHDINNALFVIAGLTEELLDEADGGPGAQEDTKDQLNTILAKAKLVGEKAHQILRLVESRRPPVSPALLQPLVESLANRMRASAPAGVEVQLQLTAPDAKAKVHPRDLEQILEAGFSNALDALPASGGVITIGLTLGTLAGGPVLSLWLQDNGRGMSAEERTRCAEPYFSTKEKAGLGLAIVKALARGMQAPLTIESSPGNGTRIQLDIPVEPAP